MASIQISKEEMLKRVAHFKELKPIDYKAMGSGYVPAGMEAFSIIGQVTKDLPTIEAPHGFTMAVTKVDPGKGAPLHSHKTAEVRAALLPIMDLAKRYNLAVLMVNHFNKASHWSVSPGPALL